MVYWVSAFYWHGTKQVPGARWLDSPAHTRPVDKSKQNAPAAHTDLVMLGWNEEVQWRGEGLRAQLHGAAAALRPSAHGAGESWKNFILQTQGIAGNVTSTAPFCLFVFFIERVYNTTRTVKMPESTPFRSWGGFLWRHFAPDWKRRSSQFRCRCSIRSRSLRPFL